MKRHRDGIASILLGLADLVVVCLVFGGAILLRFYSGLFSDPTESVAWHTLVPFCAVTCLTLVLTLAVVGAYRMPRRWQFNEALPVVLTALMLAFPISAALLYVIKSGVAQSDVLPTPSRLLTLWVWGGLLVALTGVRLLTGRIQVALYRQGVGLRRSIVVGDGARATWVTRRIGQNPWLGEHVVGRIGYQQGPDCLGHPENLADAVQRHKVDVIWLAPPSKPQTQWLPTLLFEPKGARLIWRMLPEGLRNIETALSRLSYEQLEAFHNRVQHHLALPTLRIAMLGSRGVPANYSGVEKYVEEVGSYLAQNGAHVAVYCHAKYVSQRGYYRGMELRFVPTIATKHLETITHTFLATLHALLQGEEVFHYQALGPATLSLLPRLFGRKVVVTVQGLDWDRAKWAWVARCYLKFGEWCTCHFPHAIIVVSRTLARHYAERHGTETAYIPNGFEPPVRQPPDCITKLGLRENGYILFVGRLSPEKGCHTLIRAFAQVKTDKHLVLAGRVTHDDHYQHQLLTQANGLSNVLFTGFVRGAVLQELYSNAYLVVHPSELEGLSVSLLEALSYGNCLLVSDVPENLEVVRDVGHSFQTGDSTDLARQIQLLLDRPDLIEATRRQVRSRTSSLMNWEAVAAATHKLMLELAGASTQDLFGLETGAIPPRS